MEEIWIQIMNLLHLNNFANYDLSDMFGGMGGHRRGWVLKSIRADLVFGVC